MLLWSVALFLLLWLVLPVALLVLLLPWCLACAPVVGCFVPAPLVGFADLRCRSSGHSGDNHNAQPRTQARSRTTRVTTMATCPSAWLVDQLLLLCCCCCCCCFLGALFAPPRGLRVQRRAVAWSSLLVHLRLLLFCLCCCFPGALLVLPWSVVLFLLLWLVLPVALLVLLLPWCFACAPVIGCFVPAPVVRFADLRCRSSWHFGDNHNAQPEDPSKIENQ